MNIPRHWRLALALSVFFAAGVLAFAVPIPLAAISLPTAKTTTLAVDPLTGEIKGPVSAATFASINGLGGGGGGSYTFTAADFNVSGSTISLDYASGQKATGFLPGFLTAADWVAFNAKAPTASPTFSGTVGAADENVIFAVGTGPVVTGGASDSGTFLPVRWGRAKGFGLFGEWRNFSSVTDHAGGIAYNYLADPADVKMLFQMESKFQGYSEFFIGHSGLAGSPGVRPWQFNVSRGVSEGSATAAGYTTGTIDTDIFAFRNRNGGANTLVLDNTVSYDKLHWNGNPVLMRTYTGSVAGLMEFDFRNAHAGATSHSQITASNGAGEQARFGVYSDAAVTSDAVRADEAYLTGAFGINYVTATHRMWIGGGGAGQVANSATLIQTADAAKIQSLVPHVAPSYRVPPTNLAGGTTLAIGTNYFDSFSSNRTFSSFTGTADEGANITISATMSVAVTITFTPTVYRKGETGALSGGILFPPGGHLIRLDRVNNKWELLDSAQPLNNYAASTAPTTGDDAADGYGVSSIWIDTTAGHAYICVDATVAAAAWKQLDGSITAGSTDTLTGKTYDTGGSGNVFKMKGYIQLTHPHLADGTGATLSTTATAIDFGHATFSATADKGANYVEYRITVPDDLDTSVDPRARLHIRATGADTNKQLFILSHADVGNSASDAAPTLLHPISFTKTMAAGGAGEVEIFAYATLTSWSGDLTPGHTWVIRLARDGDDGTDDTSTVTSQDVALIIEYGITQ
jgi:hypothetical protein